MAFLSYVIWTAVVFEMAHIVFGALHRVRLQQAFCGISKHFTFKDWIWFSKHVSNHLKHRNQNPVLQSYFVQTKLNTLWKNSDAHQEREEYVSLPLKFSHILHWPTVRKHKLHKTCTGPRFPKFCETIKQALRRLQNTFGVFGLCS